MRATLSTGNPIPIRRTATSYGKTISLTETMKAMEIGHSFDLDNIHHGAACHSVASRLGIKIVTEKVPLIGLRVHRVK